MIVHLDRDMAVTIEDPWDCQRFHMRIDASRGAIDRVRVALSGLATFESTDQTWVSVEALRGKVGLGDDPSWSRAFAQMVEKARSFGWVRDEPLRVAAHAVWQEDGRPSP